MGKVKGTSIWQLKKAKDNVPIATLELSISPYGAYVVSAKINCTEKLPENVKATLPLLSKDFTLEQVFQLFLAERAPKKRECEETDLWIAKQLELESDALNVGRLTGYCGFIGVISYFKTNKDDYYVTPVKKQLYYWGFMMRGFTKLYEINPIPDNV